MAGLESAIQRVASPKASACGLGARVKPGHDGRRNFTIVMAGLDPAIHGAARTNAGVYTSFRPAWHPATMGGWAYIVTNKRYGTLYTGVTSNLARRAWEHRTSMIAGFTSRYKLTSLVLAERHETISAAIQREKNIKHWPRAWKLALIEATNPAWNDLYEHLSAAHCG